MRAAWKAKPASAGLLPACNQPCPFCNSLCKERPTPIPCCVHWLKDRHLQDCTGPAWLLTLSPQTYAHACLHTCTSLRTPAGRGRHGPLPQGSRRCPAVTCHVCVLWARQRRAVPATRVAAPPPGLCCQPAHGMQQRTAAATWRVRPGGRGVGAAACRWGLERHALGKAGRGWRQQLLLLLLCTHAC